MGGVGIMSYKPSRRVVKYDLSTGSGSQTITVNLPGLDLSHAHELACQLYLTTIATDVVDTLDVRLQDTRSGVSWNTRARWTQVLGNTSASASAPYRERLALQNRITITTSERAYVEAGAGDSGEIPAGSTRNGPFLGVRRDPGTSGGGPGLTNTWRLLFTVVDANANANFVGTVTIWAD